MSTPGFKYFGGKVKLRKWLISSFPPKGNIYLEPFAGMANVYYLACQSLDYKKWLLGDINTYSLEALKKANLALLPKRITAEEYDYLKDDTRLHYEMRLIKIYTSNFGATNYSGVDPEVCKKYKVENYRPTCEEAKRLLSFAKIKEMGWDKWDYNELIENDFVYFDPPYYKASPSYVNVNHEKLIDILNQANYKWAISGYGSILYESKLKYLRRQTMKMLNKVKSMRNKVETWETEILWMNY